MYDMLTHNEVPIITDGSDQESPTIYQDRIVWVDDRNGNPDIYLYNLSTSEEKQITTDGSTQYSPAIYGDRIVWTDMRNGNSDIYMYNLSTSEETQITTDTSFQSDPAIYGDKIVWRDDRNENWNIYMYDLSTSEETQITLNEMVQRFPKIYKDRIVWEDLRNENSDIYMYDLSNATEIQITTDMSDQERPTIYDDKIVWTDNRNGNSDIYMCTISENGVKPELLANFSTNVTSGNAPLSISFKDASTGAPKFWNWDFGDGQNSTDQNPTHTYYLGGNYTAALTVTNEYCQNTKMSEINVSVQKLIADFSGVPTFGKPPLEVKFSDYSKGLPTSWKWNFGDGACSSQKNPVHTYRKSGKYNVSLTVKNVTESSTMRKTAYIDVRNHLGSVTESQGAISPEKIRKI
jgi:beta propeller repeat protein